MSEDSSSFYAASQSQRLSSSTSSLLSRSSSKHLSQAYKQASQLFLTRRLPESLSVLEPLITPAPQQDDQQDGNESSAPVATASNTLRIKVWNLYITILSAIVELGPEDGKIQFGQKEWKAIASKVRDGGIWETVVQAGYGGREGAVDADVVYNLSTLLLKHSPSQELNQQRLETYLSSYGVPDLDISAHLQDPNSETRRRKVPANGTDTPKDLAIRVRLLELFTLHVLPRNDEWEYAREFINMSEVLDEDRKEAFIQTLDSLLEEKERGTQRAAEIQREKEEELERQRQEREEMEREEEEARRRAESTQQQQQQQGGQRKAAAETDYGIDKSHPNGAASKTRTPKPALKPSRVASQSHRQQQPGSNRASKATAQKPLFFFTRLRLLANLLVRTVKNMASSMSANPLAFLRSLLIVLGFVMALARQDVRERIRRVTGAGWQKVRGTVGMGVKVSYI